MMQKSKLFFYVFFASLFFLITKIHGRNLSANIKACIAINVNSGSILHTYNANKLIPPASLTKVMTLLMIFDALETKKLRMTDMVKVSKHAASRQACNLNLKPNSYISVKQIILALITRSANDAAAAIAEHLAKSESSFAAHMTKRAREFGMSNTTFKNASGLAAAGQITTAQDMAILGLIAAKHYKKYFHLFSEKRFCYNKRCYSNHNYRLLSQKNHTFNGIKTGYIRTSGFNIIAHHNHATTPILIVVLGGVNSALRDKHVLQTLEAIKKASITRLAVPTPALPDHYVNLNLYTSNTVTETKYSLILGQYGSKLRAETIAKNALGRTTFFNNKNVVTQRVRKGGRYLYQVSVDNLSHKEAQQGYAILSYFNIEGVIQKQ